MEKRERQPGEGVVMLAMSGAGAIEAAGTAYFLEAQQYILAGMTSTLALLAGGSAVYMALTSRSPSSDNLQKRQQGLGKGPSRYGPMLIK